MEGIGSYRTGKNFIIKGFGVFTKAPQTLFIPRYIEPYRLPGIIKREETDWLVPQHEDSISFKAIGINAYTEKELSKIAHRMRLFRSPNVVLLPKDYETHRNLVIVRDSSFNFYIEPKYSTYVLEFQNDLVQFFESLPCLTETQFVRAYKLY